MEHLKYKILLYDKNIFGIPNLFMNQQYKL